MDLTTVLLTCGGAFLIVAVIVGGGMVWRWHRSFARPTAIEDLRAKMRAHQRSESLRKAAATEYRPRK